MQSCHPFFRCNSLLSSSIRLFSSSNLFSFPPFTSPISLSRNPTLSATLSTLNTSSSSSSSSSSSNSHSHSVIFPTTHRWKPMCLYYTQGQCTKMDDPVHLEKFNHDVSMELQVNVTELKELCSQPLDYLLVLDLEGKVEILEFPVVMIDAKSMNYIDSFHRFVRPVEMNENRINEYIEGKYGKLGVDRVWHDTAIPFKQVLEQFEGWITHHQLWKKGVQRTLHRAAFVTCGNWDLKTKIPQQCKVSQIYLPPYFMEWINLKDVYLNFYNRQAMGMRSMMNQLGIPLTGSHHLGIDDTKNITKVLQQMLADGAVLQITARRSSNPPGEVEFLFKNRIR